MNTLHIQAQLTLLLARVDNRPYHPEDYSYIASIILENTPLDILQRRLDFLTNNGHIISGFSATKSFLKNGIAVDDYTGKCLYSENNT
jgi:hypothetical protein